MAMNNVKLTEIIGSTLAISPRSGQKAYDFVADILITQKGPVQISFSEITDCSSAFCNSFIGKLYMNFDPNDVDTHVQFENFDANPTWVNKIHNAKLLGANENFRISRQTSINDLIFS